VTRAGEKRLLRAAAGLTALLLAAAPCRAEELAFGGTGEDELREVVSAGDGLFAVGTTSSADGDLAGRKRSGQTGWALRIGADGQRLWDFCSAKSGMLDMCAPHAYADGTLSLVLTDETRQRGEWILLSEKGRQIARTAIPQAPCPTGEDARIIGMAAGEDASGRVLMLLMEHTASGELCCAALGEDGHARGCGEFYGDAQGVLLAADGCVLHLGADLGALAMTRLSPDAPPQARTMSPFGDGVGVSRVSDALIAADGSLALCGQTVTADQKSSGFLLRLSAEGETIFARTLPNHPIPTRMTETDTGYAVLAEGAMLFFDEDGAALGETAVERTPLDLAGLRGETLMLVHDPERSRKQAVFVPVAHPARAQESEPEPEPSPKHSDGRIAIGDGYLLCGGSGAGGVTVRLVDGQGRTLWETRTPIHTAADRLVWESAARTEEGDIRLTGHYETDSADGVVQETATALLSADGVLRSIRVEE